MDSLKKPLDTSEGQSRIQILKETFERVEPISPRTQIRQHRFLIQNQLDKALIELNAQKKENYLLSRERDDLKLKLDELTKLLKSKSNSEENQDIQQKQQNNDTANIDITESNVNSNDNNSNSNNSDNGNNNNDNISYQNYNIVINYEEDADDEGQVVPPLTLPSNAPLSPLSRSSYSSHHFEKNTKEEKLELNLSFLEQPNNNANNEGEKSKRNRRNSLRGDKTKEQKKRRKSSEVYDDKKSTNKDKEFQNIIYTQNAQLISQEDNIKRLYKESCELIEEYKTVVDAQSMEINNLKNQLEQIITLAEKFEQRLNYEISSHNETRMQLEFQMLAPISNKKKGSSSYDLSRYPGDLSHNNPNLYHHLPYSYTSSSNLIDLSELKATKKKGLFKSKKVKVTELNSPERGNNLPNNNNNNSNNNVNNPQNYKFNVENPEPKQMSIEQLKREMEVVIALGEKLQSELKIEKDLHLQTQKQFFEQKNIVDNLLEANRQLNSKIRSASNKFIIPSNSNGLLSNNSNPNLSHQNNNNNNINNNNNNDNR